MLFRRDITFNAGTTLKPQINYVGKCKEVVIRSGKRRYHQPRRDVLLRRTVRLGLSLKNEFKMDVDGSCFD